MADVSLSPLESSPDNNPNPNTNNMAMVAPAHTALSGIGMNKRYRPAPAKTFQCRGYGECRMVFSRSEHLARHIRKHTGERPFSCHCTKQFSRLDNLRQHAQTVHADKQEQNERMMRELTTLHATMAAANKATGTRRRQPPPPPMIVKQEEGRPGTTAGYEGELGMVYPPSRAQQWEQQSSARPSNHSFRSSPSSQQQSFLAPSESFRLASPPHAQFAYAVSPGSSPQPPAVPVSNPPPNGNGNTLPPLASVVPPPSHPPSGVSFPRRPGTASRPNTAGASSSFFLTRPGSAGLGLLSASSSSQSQQQQQYDDPFFFHPPDINFSAGSSSAATTARKRPETSGGYEYGTDSRPASRRLSVMELCNEEGRPGTAGGVSGAGIDFAALGGNSEYYGYNNAGGGGFYPTNGGAFLLRTAAARAGAGEDRDRPTTSSGIIVGAGALVISDRDSASPQQSPPAASPTGGVYVRTSPQRSPYPQRSPLSQHSHSHGGSPVYDQRGYYGDEHEQGGVRPPAASPPRVSAGDVGYSPQQQQQQYERYGSGSPEYASPHHQQPFYPAFPSAASTHSGSPQSPHQHYPPSYQQQQQEYPGSPYPPSPYPSSPYPQQQQQRYEGSSPFPQSPYIQQQQGGGSPYSEYGGGHDVHHGHGGHGHGAAPGHGGHGHGGHGHGQVYAGAVGMRV